MTDRTPGLVGDTLGIPVGGPGSIASWPRRIAAFSVDQALLGMRYGLTFGPLAPGSGASGRAKLAWFVAAWALNLVLLPVLTGRTVGKALFCLRIRQLDEDRRPRVRGAIVRALYRIVRSRRSSRRTTTAGTSESARAGRSSSRPGRGGRRPSGPRDAVRRPGGHARTAASESCLAGRGRSWASGPSGSACWARRSP